MAERHLYGGVCRRRRDWAVSIFRYSGVMGGDGCYALARHFRVVSRNYKVSELCTYSTLR